MLPNSSTGQNPVEQSFSQHKTRQSTDIPAEKDCWGLAQVFAWGDTLLLCGCQPGSKSKQYCFLKLNAFIHVQKQMNRKHTVNKIWND